MCVLFPSLSLIQENLKRITELFLKSVQITSFIIFMLMVLLYLNAEEFVYLVLGEQWKSLIPLLKILALPSALQSITLLTENIFRSQNKYSLEFKLNIFVSAILLIAIIIGLQWGISGVAYSYLFGVVITTGVILFVTAKALKCNIMVILKEIYPSFLSFLILVGLKSLYSFMYTSPQLNMWISFILQIILGTLIYIGFVYLINKQTIFNVFKILKKIIK